MRSIATPTCLVWILMATLAIGEFDGQRLIAAPVVTTRPTATSSHLVSCDLSLSQIVLDPQEKSVGTTSIRGQMFSISSMQLIDQKPAGILKEPTYVGHPVYGAFRIGNGPKAVTYFAVDEAKDYAGKIYIDYNQNGDLTDDASCDWDQMFVRNNGRNWEKTFKVHASWGTALEEKEYGEYTILLTKPEGKSGCGFARITGREGSMALGDKIYPIVLGENTNDGLFTVAANGDLTRSAVILYMDIDGAVPAGSPVPKVNPKSDHTFEHFNLGDPFEVDHHWYVARPTVSGSTLKVLETQAPGTANKAPEAPQHLSAGDVAPPFTVQSPDGKPLSLGDFKGKVVILDFWATWCGPCQASMPGLEKTYQKIKAQDVVVLSVNVEDAKPPFDKWMSIHADKDYHFTFGFDPAGKGDDSVATSKYHAFAIPAQFVITRDGKIAANLIGFDATQSGLIKALKEQESK